jgi:hypothetical protein
MILAGWYTRRCSAKGAQRRRPSSAKRHWRAASLGSCSGKECFTRISFRRILAFYVISIEEKARRKSRNAVTSPQIIFGKVYFPNIICQMIII